jgi:hypothetical protein
MTELWLLAFVPVLTWLLAKMRARRLLAKAEQQLALSERVSAEEMGEVVKDLSPTLRPRVTSPNLPVESNHVWDSPSGKRVYIN